jgi:hypothetical protein
MKNKWIRALAFIKSKLGICCSNRCFKRAVVEVILPDIKVK